MEARHFDAVTDVDLDVMPGSFTVCTGHSGSGKTTLLTMLAGLLEPTKGIVEIEGTSIYGLGDARLSQVRNASIGFVPQVHAPVHSLTLVQNVMLAPMLYNAADLARLEPRAMQLLGRLGLDKLADCYPAELSGGELRRMAVARAMMMQPKVLLADEPTDDLDESNTALVLGMLREAANEGSAVLVVSHDSQAQAYADEVVCMEAGVLSAASIA